MHAVRVALEIADESICVDFSASDPPVEGYVNSTLPNTASSAFLALFMSLGTEMRFNLETAVERHAQCVPWGAGGGDEEDESRYSDARLSRSAFTHQVKPKKSTTLNPATLFSRFTAVNCRF